MDCRGYTFLQRTHFAGKCRLVTHRTGHTTQQSRDLGTCLGKAEDIVNEEQDIVSPTLLCTCIAERLGNCQARKRHRCTCTGRLIHLSINKSGLGFFHLIIIYLREVPFASFKSFSELFAIADNVRLNHLTQQVVALACTFSHSGKNRESVVPLGYVIYKFHYEHSLAHTGTAKEADFSSLAIRFKKVNYLYARIQHLFNSGEFFEFWSLTMYWICTFTVEFLETVNGVTHNVHHASFYLCTYRHCYGLPCGYNLKTTCQTCSAIHGNSAHRIVADVLLHLKYKLVTVLEFHTQRLMNGWERAPALFIIDIKIHINDSTNNLCNMSFVL